MCWIMWPFFLNFVEIIPSIIVIYNHGWWHKGRSWVCWLWIHTEGRDGTSSRVLSWLTLEETYCFWWKSIHRRRFDWFAWRSTRYYLYYSRLKGNIGLFSEENKHHIDWYSNVALFILLGFCLCNVELDAC